MNDFHSISVMQNLDDIQTYLTLDPQRAYQRALDLPHEIETAYAAGAALAVMPPEGGFRQVLVAGMGGAGMGGDLAYGLAQTQLPVPMQVLHGYDLPVYANAASLLIACSYSGNTEEVLSVTEQALAKGCRVVAIAKGGALAQLSQTHRLPWLKIASDDPAGEVIGWMTAGGLGVLVAAKLLPALDADIAETCAVLAQANTALNIESPARRNPAKRIAGQFMDRLPIIYGAGLTAAVAQRWKTMLNSYAKMLAAVDVLPELNHNAIEGYEHCADVWRRSIVLQLRSDYDHARVSRRFDLTTRFLLEAGVNQDTVRAKGKSALAQLFSLVVFGDWVAYYTAIISGLDPIIEERIPKFKEAMQKP